MDNILFGKATACLRSIFSYAKETSPPPSREFIELDFEQPLLDYQVVKNFVSVYG